MKKLFTIICLLVSVMARGQLLFCSELNFDNSDTCYKHFITIDTVNYHHNLWQVGRPQKVVLDSALSAPNVLITDTLNTYPSNDTSVFSLKIPVTDESGMWGLVSFNFKYRLDIDSNAKAFVEMSIDSGLHWINTIDTLPAYASWHGPKPRFDTSTASWLTFDLSWPLIFSAPYHTLLVRFTFISDSVTSGKDGWMIDNIHLGYWWESVPLLQNPNLITLYPNPSHGNIYIHTDKPHKDATVTITNIQGQQVYNGAVGNGYLNLQLPNGVYTLKYSDEEEYCVKQVMIQN